MTQRAIIMHERMVLSYFSGRLSPARPDRSKRSLLVLPRGTRRQSTESTRRPGSQTIARSVRFIPSPRTWIAAAAKVVTAGRLTLARYAQNSAAAAGLEE